MYFYGNDQTRVLVRPDGQIPVNNAAIIKYIGKYLDKPTPFFGYVECPKITDSVVRGIYVMPTSMFTNNKWHTVSVKKPIPYKYFLYPALLIDNDLNSIESCLPSDKYEGHIELNPILSSIPE
jgi:hypothetical protein